MRKGFSAHDLLMVLCIIGILWLVALPVIVHQMRVRAKERKVAQAIASATAVAPTAELPTDVLPALYARYDSLLVAGRVGSVMIYPGMKTRCIQALEEILDVYKADVNLNPLAVERGLREKFWPRLIRLEPLRVPDESMMLYNHRTFSTLKGQYIEVLHRCLDVSRE